MAFRVASHVTRGKEHWVFGLVLLLALVNGIIFVYLVPPWQHYDEPGHFEYAWLIANTKGLPETDTFDQRMRREVAASMVENGFFDRLNYRPNLLLQNEPIWIGIAQIDDRPLYHWIASIPLRLLQSTDVLLQLYAARLVSLLLYLTCITAAYGITAELTPPNHPLRLLIPLTLALLPGFTDLMTAVNDDVGATAFFSLFLWISIRMMVRGFSWPRLFGIIITSLLCFYTKNTVTVAVALLVFPLLFSLLQSRKRLVWIVLLIGAIAGVLSIFSWGDAAAWSRQTNQSLPTRVSTKNAPLGSHAFQLGSSSESQEPKILQILSDSKVKNLQDQTVTVGAWIWSDRVTQARTPVILDGDQGSFLDVTIGPEPAYYSFTWKVSAKTNQLRIFLSPEIQKSEAESILYYDGIVLAVGDYSPSGTPNFNDPSGTRGTWGGEPFTNLIQNPSAESAWPWIRPWANSSIARFFPMQPSLILSSLLNWSSAFWYYRAASANLFYTFWGKFGWGHVPLVAFHPYRILIFISLMGVLGSGLAILRRWRRLPWDVLMLLGIVILTIWGPTLMRGISSLTGEIFFPAARYAYPAIIPTILLLNVGWLEFFREGECRLRLPLSAKYIVFSLFFIALDVVALLSIVRYYG